MSRPKKIWIGLAGAVGLLAIVLLAGLIVIQTDWFRDQVRARIVSEAETATGGRVEIGNFNYDWRSLSAEVSPFTLHGKEAPGAPPFFRAERIRIGLKIISLAERKADITSLIVEKPQVNVTVNPDGSTNVPTPKAVSKTNKNFAEQLLDLKVRHFELRDGFADYNDQRTPIDIKGDRLQASVTYETKGPRYVAQISARQLQLGSPHLKAPLAVDFDTRLALAKNEVQVIEATLAGDGSKVAVSGFIRNLAAPQADFEVKASAPVKELNKTVGLPFESVGIVTFEGKGSAAGRPLQYKLEGKLTGRDLAISQPQIQGATLSTRLEITPAKISARDLQLYALHGRFTGSAQVVDLKKFSLAGTVVDVQLDQLANLWQRQTGELSGTVGGAIKLDGSITSTGAKGIVLETQLAIVPGSGRVPVRGDVALNYDQRAGKLGLGNSKVTLGSTSIALSGTFGETLTGHIASRNLNDILVLLPLFGAQPPDKLPELHGGEARFDGVVTGPFDNLKISGTADATKVAWGEHQFDHVESTLDIDKSGANLRSLAMEQDKLHVSGQGHIGLTDWKAGDSSPINASVSIRGADIAKLLKDNGSDVPVTGALSATARVTGTLESPLVNASLDAQNITAYNEHFDQAHGDITMSATALELTNGEAQAGSVRITASGGYDHLAKDWKDGSVRFDIAGNQVSLAKIKRMQEYRDGVGGDVNVKASGTAKVVNGVLTLASLNGQLAVRNIMVDGHPYGSLDLTANTKLPVLDLVANVDLRGTQLHGTGQWRLDGDYPGQASIQIPRITFSTLHDLWPGQHERKELPFQGFIQGGATITGPLNNPGAMQAAVTLTTVQLRAGPNVHPVAGTQVEDLVLQNAQPVVFEATTKSINVRSAAFVAKDTTLTATGRLGLDSKSPWDIAVKGNIDMSILQIFNPDLLATGKSLVNMTVRGPLTEPQVDGRVEVQNASLFIRDLPNGVDQANGLILFDRNRATIENLTGITGGGRVTFDSGSFVGFRGPALIYRLQAAANQVRYRSPDGISITVNATVSLIGTSENSVLSGNVVVVRAAFNPRTDVGSLLASTAKPVSVPSTNEYLRGIQFDVRVESSRNLQVETALTHNIQADASLRLRGTPERPIVLGSISVNSGEIEFFGNKYTISRGDVNFYNPSKVEPIIDLDLETRVRGIVVDISFSGSLNKLNSSYRSDPPLETNEIISLLAVGRQPTTYGGLSAQTTSNAGFVSTGSSALLGQALAPASGRLQRFFGVSHIKIDPQLTDITSVPQARLTVEQQVSADITLTYITNLSRTDQQIVRVEWDLTKKWSVVALRDENGAFGVDFQFRKRFK